MRHSALLHRGLPALALCAALLAAALPASAFFFDREEESAPAVLSFSKNGLAADPIAFTQSDFQVEGEGAALDAIVVGDLPDAGAGALTLGGQSVASGDVITMDAVDGLRFTPQTDPAVSSTGFTFTPVFADGSSGEAATVSLYLLTERNEAPTAQDLEMSTYKNVAVTGQFTAVDPEGDLLTFHILHKPARGSVTLSEDGSARFVYTPYENKTGKDSFTFVAVDAVGNSSAPATVKIKIEKPDTKVTYADMEGDPAHKAAIRLAEEDVFVGECMGGSYFFCPDQTVSRGEFVAMAMHAAGVEALEGVETTGFADNEAIPTWARPYVASALKAGLVQGSRGEDGQVVFQAQSAITPAEAAVFLDRVLQLADVSAENYDAQAPVWAAQSVANLADSGVMGGQGDLEQAMTRGEAAQMLCSALELMESQEDGWFIW